MLAYTSIGAVAGTYGLARRGNVWAVLPSQTRVALNGLVGMVSAQAALGISTLLLYGRLASLVPHCTRALTPLLRRAAQVQA